MNPVSVPTAAIASGRDFRSAAAHLAGALDQANERLKASRTWYESVRGRCGEGA